jgi:hypothetical protein
VTGRPELDLRAFSDLDEFLRPVVQTDVDGSYWPELTFFQARA